MRLLCISISVQQAELTRTSGGPEPTSTGTGTVLSNYPTCAQTCGTTYSSLGDRNDPAFDCGPLNRGTIAACEVLTCSDTDYQMVQQLAIDRCGAYYEANPSISSTVSSAIASATAEALAALATRDPTDLASYPPCSARGIPPVLAANVSSCLTLSNRDCICGCPTVYDLTTPQEQATCSPAELRLLNHLVDSLCAHVSGVTRRPEACHPPIGGNATYAPTSTGATGSGVTPTASPSLVPFTGEAVRATISGKLIMLFAIMIPVLSLL
ncbi:hypothetical protein G7Y79_00087g101110 [Physcia stellaris]|nr:hypothetical protein G7Y79_00087g101110 [Physcia stellaris]